MSILESLISPILNFLVKLLGRRMPLTKEQIEPYSDFREELTRLYMDFRIIKGRSPSRNMQEFIWHKECLLRTNRNFYSQLVNTRTILDESDVEFFNGLVDAVFTYVSILDNLKLLNIEDERAVRQAHVNECEESLDMKFIEAEYNLRQFLFGFSFKAWKQMRKIKSRRK